MRTRIVLAFALIFTLLMPTVASADPNNEPDTFLLVLPVPNDAEASNGDQVAVLGSGSFSVHPKSVTASGTFTHTFAGGGSVSGTWVATDLLSFEFYGCGVIPALGITVPPFICGGALKLAVALTPAGTTLTLPGVLTIFCIVGPQAPPTHDNPLEGEEGITLVVPGVANFNKIVPPNMNFFVDTTP